MRREKPVKLYVTFYTYAEAMAMDADLELRADIEKLLKQENIEFEELAELSA